MKKAVSEGDAMNAPAFHEGTTTTRLQATPGSPRSLAAPELGRWLEKVDQFGSRGDGQCLA